MPRSHRRIGIVLALAIATFVPACSSGDAADPGGGRGSTVAAPGESWIAFQEEGVAGQRIALVRPDGGGGHPLTPDLPDGDQTNPDWSPDGERLVFAFSDGLRDDLWVADADGSGAERLLDCAGACVALDDPSWSPDGRAVVYTRLQETSGSALGTLEILHLADRRRDVVLTAAPDRFMAGPRWAPDGRSVVVEMVRRSGRGLDDEVTGAALAIVDLAGGPTRVREITEPAAFAETADWHPDGDLIVYAARPEPGAESTGLFTIRPDGSGSRPLPTPGADAGIHPSFTPDGQRIVFEATIRAGDTPGMALIARDGSDLQPATASGYIPGVHPRLRPVP